MNVRKRIVKRINEYRGVICIGIGKQFEGLEQLFGELQLLNNVKACFDNNETKHGKTITLGKRAMVVEPIENICRFNNTNTLIVIAILKSEDVRKQLDRLKLHVDIVDYSHILHVIREDDAMKKNIPGSIRLTQAPVIPKVIHYCWFGNGVIPDLHKKYIEGWHEKCPDYEIKLWNEKNYDVNKNQYMKEAYNSKCWGFVPDYARLDIIYQYGGIYLDTDVELLRNMDDMLYQSGFAGVEPGNRVAFGLGFGAVAGLSIIKELRDAYKSIRFIKENAQINNKPSPVYQTEKLKEYGFRQNGEYQIVEGLTIFPEKMFCPQPGAMQVIRTKSYTCSIHHYEGSWLDEEKKRDNNIWAIRYNEFLRKWGVQYNGGK